MKKIILISLLSLSIIGCTKSKEEVIESCVEQANNTFSKESTDSKARFVYGCAKYNGYEWNTNECVINNPISALLPLCYISKKELSKNLPSGFVLDDKPIN